MFSESFVARVWESVTLTSLVAYLVSPVVWVNLVGGFVVGWMARSHFRVRLEKCE